ncbi:MAG: hydrogenase maturation nickel metallochaperone HypA [Solobacterium sp.]|nr:hydrogenase maturation nickel metallochaperone HypA [Solobacterium sp.]
MFLFNRKPEAGTLAVCANCKQTYIKGDKYCRYCGSRMGRPEYIPQSFSCIYGPPPTERKHICRNCGHTWTTVLMIDKEEFCPKCGGRAPAEYDMRF